MVGEVDDGDNLGGMGIFCMVGGRVAGIRDGDRMCGAWAGRLLFREKDGVM